MARIGVTGMGPHAFRARNAEALLEGGAGAAAAAAVVGEGEDTNSDLYACGDYRRHLARVHAARAIAAALTRALVKIGGTYPLPFRRSAPTTLLQDPAVLCRCMPGCESLDQTGEGEYAMQMKMVLASDLRPVRWQGADHRGAAAHQFRLHVEGSGKIGFMKGERPAHVFARRAPARSVQYDGEVQVGGTIASVGQRLMETTAKMLIKRFFDKLGKEAVAAAG